MIQIELKDGTVYLTHSILGGIELWFNVMREDGEMVLVNIKAIDVKLISIL